MLYLHFRYSKPSWNSITQSRKRQTPVWAAGGHSMTSPWNLSGQWCWYPQTECQSSWTNSKNIWLCEHCNKPRHTENTVLHMSGALTRARVSWLQSATSPLDATNILHTDLLSSCILNVQWLYHVSVNRTPILFIFYKSFYSKMWRWKHTKMFLYIHYKHRRKQSLFL